jgi:hypothetical protein
VLLTLDVVVTAFGTVLLTVANTDVVVTAFGTVLLTVANTDVVVTAFGTVLLTVANTDVVVTAFGTVLLAVANTDVVVVLNSVAEGKFAAGNVVTEGIMVVVEAESTRLDATVVEVLVVEFVIFVPSGQPPVGAGTTSPTCE